MLIGVWTLAIGSGPSGAAFLTARAVDYSPPGMGHVGCATDEPRCCSSGQAVCATCWGDDAVHAERYQLKEPGRQAKRSTTTKATIRASKQICSRSQALPITTTH